MAEKQPRSEGELLIEEYFGEAGIDFQAEVKIEHLKGDNIPYRKADFYLPKYKTYVEFLGRWNVESSKKAYREKQRIYEQNKIPCVYLYPDNLGILNSIFRKRLKDALIKYNLKKQLLRLKWDLFQEKYLSNLIILIVLIFIVPYWYFKVALGAYLFYSLYVAIKSTFFAKS
jgi:hypothetical protein